jgi:hypothetical protein
VLNPVGQEISLTLLLIPTDDRRRQLSHTFAQRRERRNKGREDVKEKGKKKKGRK